MRPALLGAALVLALAAGCTAGSTPAGRPPAPKPSATSTTPVAVPDPPPPDACYRIGYVQAAAPSDSSAPVSCGTRHDAQTIYVGNLRTVFDGHSLAIDSDRVRRQLASTCPGKLAKYLGGTRQARRLSRFGVVWFAPTKHQSDAGAAWFRCDAIAFDHGRRLYPLPRHLHGALGRAGVLSTYGLCGTAAPGSPGFQRVICARTHSWRAISTIPLAGGKAYPGAARVRTAGDSACQALVRRRTGFALHYRYGWEWPTRSQWAAGQHYGYCWAPA